MPSIFTEGELIDFISFSKVEKALSWQLYIHVYENYLYIYLRYVMASFFSKQLDLGTPVPSSPPHTELVLLIFTQSSTSDIKHVHKATGSEEITLTWRPWHAVSHIFQCLDEEVRVNVTFVLWKVLCHHSYTDT